MFNRDSLAKGEEIERVFTGYRGLHPTVSHAIAAIDAENTADTCWKRGLSAMRARVRGGGKHQNASPVGYNDGFPEFVASGFSFIKIAKGYGDNVSLSFLNSVYHSLSRG